MSRPAVPSFEYRLQRDPVGVVVLDGDRRVTAANAWAASLLSGKGRPWQGADILDLHPPAVRDKVRWLLDTARALPDQPTGMVLTLPMGSLIARVTALAGPVSGTGEAAGWCMMFHAIDPAAPAPAEPWLIKLPLSSRAGLALMDVAGVVFLRAEGHYTRAVANGSDALCTLPLAELTRRLDPEQFLRVHRSYLVNLRHARAVERADGQWWLVMDTGKPARVPVSRANIDDLRRRLAI